MPFFPRLALLLSLLGVAAAAYAAPGAFERVAIIDPAGFERPMTAYTLEVPSGWQSRGGMVWSVGGACRELANGPSIQWTAQAPDGRHALEILPSWYSELPDPRLGPLSAGCPQAAFSSIRDFLQAYAQQRRPAGRMLDYRDRPDLAASKANVPAPMGGELLSMRSWAEAGEILVGWDEGGIAMREIIVVVGVFTENRAQIAMIGETRSVSLYTNPIAVVRAPDGQLDRALLEHAAESMQADPAWQARMAGHHGVINAQNRKGAADRSQIIANTGAEIAQIQHEGWRVNSQLNESSHNRTVEGIREIQYYHDPYIGRPVEISSHYNHTWRLENGSYYGTNDPNFNPATQLGINGVQLQPIRR